MRQAFCASNLWRSLSLPAVGELLRANDRAVVSERGHERGVHLLTRNLDAGEFQRRRRTGVVNDGDLKPRSTAALAVASTHMLLIIPAITTSSSALVLSTCSSVVSRKPFG